MRVVVVGCGWGGWKVIRSAAAPAVSKLVSISTSDAFVFTPLLASTCVGTLEPRNVGEPVRRAKAKAPLEFHQAELLSVDSSKKVITVAGVYGEAEGEGDGVVEAKRSRPRYEVEYDKLVIAVGASPQTFGIPGVEKYAFFLKQIEDGRRIRKRLMQCFERASSPTTSDSEKRRLLTFVMVGGGPTSVELAGELYDFLQADVSKVYPELLPYASVSVLEASEHVLGAFDTDLVNYTEKTLLKRRIHVRLNARITKLTRHHIHIEGEEPLPFGMCVWSTGLKPSPLVESLPFAKGPGGRLLVDDHLRIVGEPDIHAIGDCAVEENPAPGSAPTAQSANQQGKYLGQLLSGEHDDAFKYEHQGMMSYIGGKSSVVSLSKWGFSGVSAWLAWNAAYLTDAVAFNNMLLNPAQWLKVQIFGRDIMTFKTKPDEAPISELKRKI